MLSSLNLLNRVVWTTSGLLCIAIVFLAFGNKKAQNLPLFFALVGWYPIDFFLFFMVQRSRSFAIWVWCTSFLMVSLFLLELAVLYELSKILIFSRTSLGKRFDALPKWALAVLILFSTILMAALRNASSDLSVSAFAKLTYAEDFIEIALLLALILLTRILAISWRSLPAGIALGWGISSLFDLGSAMFIGPGDQYGFLCQDIVRGIGFNACVLVWLWFTLRPEVTDLLNPPSLDITDLDLQMSDELHRWHPRPPSWR